MAEDPTGVAPRAGYSTETLMKIMSQAGLAMHGEDFDHVMPDPVDVRGWIIVLKDGTTDYARIGCIRP